MVRKIHQPVFWRAGGVEAKRAGSIVTVRGVVVAGRGQGYTGWVGAVGAGITAL